MSIVGIVGRHDRRLAVYHLDVPHLDATTGLPPIEVGFEFGVPTLLSWPAASGHVFQLRAVYNSRRIATSEATAEGRSRAPRPGPGRPDCSSG